MLLLRHPLKWIFSTAPVDLFHFSPFPGRFVEKALWETSTQYYNAAVARDDIVDPQYNWRDAGWKGSVAQGASLWKPGHDLARLISAHWHTTDWEFIEEDPAMIWEIPKGTEIPKVLQLLQQDTACFDDVYVLQPRQPMLFDTLNRTIRDFQIDIVTDGYTRHPLAGEKPSRVIRVHDWMTSDNPLVNLYPEITEGYIPDREGNSYGRRYIWETVRLVWKPVLEGYTSKGFDNHMFHPC